MTLFLKLFFLTAVPFGFFTGLYAGTHYEPFDAVIAGVIFGLFMSLILGTLHQIVTRKLEDSPLTQPAQTLAIDMNISANEAFDKSLKVLGQFGAKLTRQDRAQGCLEACTGISWKSFGETISIVISERNSGRSHIEIKSWPKLKTTIIDYGKGRGNVQRIAQLLQV